MKDNQTGTYDEAVRLLRESGQAKPSPERVELTRFLMQTCKEIGWNFTRWDEPLYPALDSFGDVELLTEIEAAFGVRLDEAEMMAASLDTLGDLVTYLDPHLASVMLPTSNEREKIARAACATQTAFYAVRRRLCDAGASYPAVHALRPSTKLRRLSNAQTEAFIQGLGTDYGFDIPLRSVVWGWMETEALVLDFFFLSAFVFLFLALTLTGGIWTGIALWILSNAAFSFFTAAYSRYKWPKHYQTLGDVARKIADASAPQPAPV